MNNLARLGERNRSWEVFGDFDDLMGHWFRAPTMVQREGNAKAPAMDVSESEILMVSGLSNKCPRTRTSGHSSGSAILRARDYVSPY